MSVPMDPISPCVCRNPSRYVVRSVRHVSIARSEYLRWPPRDVRRAPHTLSLITDPNRQITPLAQALVIFCPVDHPIPRLIKRVPSRCVELMWHLSYPLC